MVDEWTEEELKKEERTEKIRKEWMEGMEEGDLYIRKVRGKSVEEVEEPPDIPVVTDEVEEREEEPLSIEEEKKQTLLTKEVKELSNSPEHLNKGRKFLLRLVEENSFLSEVSTTELILDNHRGFFTVYDIDTPRVWNKKGPRGGNIEVHSSGPMNETFFYNLSEDDDEYREKTVDLLRRLRNLDDWILEKENLDWLVEKEKHLGIKRFETI